MNKKFLKLVPATLLIAMVATSCGKQKAVNSLDAFVRGLKGDLTEEQVNAFFEKGVIDGGDEDVKQALWQSESYAPLSAWVTGLTQEQYEELVGHELNQGSYTVYSNDVIVATESKAKAPYLASHAASDDVAIDYDHIQRSSDSSIIFVDDNDLVNYVNTRDNNPADPWSFVAKRDNDAGLMDELKHQGGMSNDVVAAFSEVQETYAHYFSAWGSDGDLIDGWENLTGHAEDGKLEIAYEAGMDFWGLYSAEAYWGSEFAGYYVKMWYDYSCYINVEDGVISSVDACFMGLKRKLYKDKNWKAGDPTPGEDLTEAQLAALDLYLPEKVYWPGEGEIDNPYDGKEPLSNSHYDTFHLECSAKEKGSYTKTLPNVSDYRDVEDDDIGAWIDVQDFLNWEAE